MSLRTTVPLALAVLLAPSSANAASHMVRATPNNRFEPSQLTIQAGDTVTWVNDGGLHNVAANDGSFRCAVGCDATGGDGDPSSAAWSFTLTFDDPEVVDYVCEVHAGLGMTGRIEVESENTPPPEPEPEPGVIRLDSASVSASEGDGAVLVRVRRVGGSDGQIAVEIRTEDGSALAGMDYDSLDEALTWVDGDSDPQDVPVGLLDDEVAEGDESFDIVLSSPSGGASLGSVRRATVTIADDDAEPTLCEVDETTHCLQEDRFRVRVHWRDQRDREGQGHRIDLTEDSGLFWFFEPSNAEMLVKVLDACGSRFDTYWVFLAAVTDVEYEVEVLDTATGRKRFYRNELGEKPIAVTDTRAFDTCP